MENILITGGCGFIGSNFIRYLLLTEKIDARIINIDKLTYAGNPENLADIAEKYKGQYVFEKVDIGAMEPLSEVFERYAVDTVCHFAAESHVDRSIVSPDAFVKTNITGTFNLLEAARLHPRVALFHHVSTDEVYGSLGASGYFTEETPYRPNSPYSASKAASDHLVRAYGKTYGLNITISNCSNNYGPYQFPEKLIPLMILNAYNHESLPVYGDGLNVRDWLFVMDHCKAIWAIMQKGRRGEMYNVGGGCEMSNIDVVTQICDYLDATYPGTGLAPRKELVAFTKDRPGHDRRYAIDYQKIETELGWRPVESFVSGIQKTIDWYLANPEWVAHVKSGEYLSWMKRQYGTS